jgi:predicted O-methyltransferase YrrM
MKRRPRCRGIISLGALSRHDALVNKRARPGLWTSRIPDFATHLARSFLRRIFAKRVSWTQVQAYKRPRIQFGAIPIEPGLHVIARDHHPRFSSVHRSLVACAKNPTGVLSELARYSGERSELTVKHDPYGAEASVPIAAADDFHKIRTGRAMGDLLPWNVDRFESQRFLYFLVRELRPDRVLELGTAHGLSGLHMLAAFEENQRGHLHTVEIDPTRRELAVQAFERFFPHNKRWTSIESSFSGVLPRLAQELEPLDLIFEDGPHTREVTLEAFEQTIDYLRPNGVYVVDDIAFDREQEKAWVAIRNDPRVEASLEINARFGLCFRAAS